MSDLQHAIRIIAHVVQALSALIFLFLMWKWGRPEKKIHLPKEQIEAAERCVALINKLERKHLEAILSSRYKK